MNQAGSLWPWPGSGGSSGTRDAWAAAQPSPNIIVLPYPCLICLQTMELLRGPSRSPSRSALPFPPELPAAPRTPFRSPAPRAPGAPLLRSHVASGSPAHRGRVQAEGGGANRGTTARRAEGGVATGGRACAIEPGNGAEGAGGARRKARGEDWGESKGTERPGRGRKTAGTASVRKGGRKGKKERRKGVLRVPAEKRPAGPAAEQRRP